MDTAMAMAERVTLAGVRIERTGSVVSFHAPRDWGRTAATSVAVLLAPATAVAAPRPAALFTVLLLAALLLPFWIVATAKWPRIQRLRRRLEIRSPERSYRSNAPPREVRVDDRVLEIHDVQFVGIGVTSIRERLAPCYAVYVVCSQTVVDVAETRRPEQAVALARHLRTELTLEAGISEVFGAPSPGFGAGCLGPLVAAVVLLGVYLGGLALALKWPSSTFETMTFSPERAVWLAAATGVWLIGVALVSRFALERWFRVRIRASLEQLFGVPGER